MPYFVDSHGTCSIVYFIDHAVVPLTDTMAVIEAGELL
jgi:hypothetical protein